MNAYGDTSQYLYDGLNPVEELSPGLPETGRKTWPLASAYSWKTVISRSW